jgi:uncharacterized protein
MAGPVFSTAGGTRFTQPIGWPLFAVPDANGRLNYPDLETSVREKIEVILRTAPGEQLMRARFGVGLEQMIHRPNTLQLRNDVETRIADHLASYEPRIMVDRIVAVPGDDQRTLLITIAYRIRITGVAGQISAQLPLGGV